jgi:O-antigen/teichoic acid export membrane protein
VWIYASKHISATEYGLFQKFWSQLFVFTAFGTIGFPVFILTYSAPKAVAILKRIQPKGVILFSGLLITLSLVFGFLQNHNEEGALALASLLFIAFVAVILSDSLLIVFKSFKAIISINLVYSILFCGIHFWNIHQGFNLQKLLLWILTLCLARLFFCLIFILKKYRLFAAENELLDNIDWQKIKALWIQLGINDVITVLFRWTDKFILSLILAKELFAVYFNGTIEIPFLAILFSAVSSAAVQHWANHHIANDSEGKIPLLHYSARILSSIMFPLFFFFIFFRIEFLSIVFSEEYVSGVWIFVCTQLVLPVRAYPFTALLQSEHRGDIINKGAIIDFILACVLMYPLYLLMGLPGIALSFVISTYWQAAYYLIHTSRITNKPINLLIPIKLLLGKFLTSGLILFSTYLLAKVFFESTELIFFLGVIVLLSTSSFSLWFDWNKSNKTSIKI